VPRIPGCTKIAISHPTMVRTSKFCEGKSGVLFVESKNFVELQKYRQRVAYREIVQQGLWINALHVQ